MEVKNDYQTGLFSPYFRYFCRKSGKCGRDFILAELFPGSFYKVFFEVWMLINPDDVRTMKKHRTSSAIFLVQTGRFVSIHSLRHLARPEVLVQVRARRLREHEVVRDVVGARPLRGPEHLRRPGSRRALPDARPIF